MRAALILAKDASGQEWRYGLYLDEVANRVVRGVADSMAGRAGLVARVAGLVEVDEIPPARADGFETSESSHRLAWRAVERARKIGQCAFAVHGKQRIPLKVHHGALGGRICYSGPRYMIDGREYVLCADRHFEPSESRDAEGRLTSYYEGVIAAE